MNILRKMVKQRLEDIARTMDQTGPAVLAVQAANEGKQPEYFAAMNTLWKQRGANTALDEMTKANLKPQEYAQSAAQSYQLALMSLTLAEYARMAGMNDKKLKKIGLSSKELGNYSIAKLVESAEKYQTAAKLVKEHADGKKMAPEKDLKDAFKVLGDKKIEQNARMYGALMMIDYARLEKQYMPDIKAELQNQGWKALYTFLHPEAQQYQAQARKAA